MSELNRGTLIAYSLAWLSFLFRERVSELIKAVYLFGSIARGEFDESSDVDIFIDVKEGAEEGVKRACERALKKFYNSTEFKKFELLGVKNELRPIVGLLSEWELKESIEREALVLFSQSLQRGLIKHFLLSIKPIRDIAKRNRVMRLLRGRKERGMRTKGFIEEVGGRVLSPRLFLLPAEELNKVVSFLSREKVEFSLVEVWL